MSSTWSIDHPLGVGPVLRNRQTGHGFDDRTMKWSWPQLWRSNRETLVGPPLGMILWLTTPSCTQCHNFGPSLTWASTQATYRSTWQGFSHHGHTWAPPLSPLERAFLQVTLRRCLLILQQVFSVDKRSSQPWRKTRLGTIESLTLATRPPPPTTLGHLPLPAARHPRTPLQHTAPPPAATSGSPAPRSPASCAARRRRPVPRRPPSFRLSFDLLVQSAIRT